MIDVRFFYNELLRQKFYCCNNIQTNKIPTKRKSNNSNIENALRTNFETTQNVNNNQSDKIIFENKYNEKITLKSDSSSIEPVYKESGFNVKH